MAQTDTVREDDLVVHTGRVTIPSTIRELADMQVGEIIIVSLVENGETNEFSARVDTHYRITIPARLRNKYGIGDGDRASIEFNL